MNSFHLDRLPSILNHLQDLIGRHIFQGLDASIRPTDFHCIDLVGLPQPEVGSVITLRQVSDHRYGIFHLAQLANRDSHSGSDR